MKNRYIVKNKDGKYMLDFLIGLWCEDIDESYLFSEKNLPELKLLYGHSCEIIKMEVFRSIL